MTTVRVIIVIVIVIVIIIEFAHLLGIFDYDYDYDYDYGKGAAPAPRWRNPMQFHVDCECGKQIAVNEGSAGTMASCTCGRSIAVPSLIQLKRQAGLTAEEINPELVIQSRLARGELPGDNRCAHCGVTATEIVLIDVVCEKEWTKQQEGFRWGLFLVSLLLPFKFLSWQREIKHGRNVVYRLPLAICNRCQDEHRSSRDLRYGLRRIPVYARLLDKHPQAEVYQSSPGGIYSSPAE